MNYKKATFRYQKSYMFTTKEQILETAATKSEYPSKTNKKFWAGEIRRNSFVTFFYELLSWTHQCWLTRKYLETSTEWMQSRVPGRCDGRQGRIERKRERGRGCLRESWSYRAISKNWWYIRGAFNKFPDFFCTRIYNYRRLLKIQYVIAIHLIRWLTNFYDLRFKWTATAGIGIHPTKTGFSQLVNSKNAIRTWGHFRRTIYNKIRFKLGKMP